MSSATEPVGRFEQEVGGVAQHPAPCGVDHVRRGQPVMDPRSGGAADRRLDDVDERGHVVVGDRLAARTPVDERRRRRPVPADGTSRRRPPGRRRASAHASVASSSISSQRAKRATSSKIAAISGMRVAGDHRQITGRTSSIRSGSRRHDRADTDEADRHADLALDQLDAARRPPAGRSPTSRTAAQLGMPPRQLLVDRRDLGQLARSGRGNR